MIDRNFIVKNTENFSRHIAKSFAWKFLTVTDVKKTKWFHSLKTSMIMFTQSKSIQFFIQI